MQLYFALAEKLGYVKIGKSEDVESRIRQLQTGCPEKLILLGSTPNEKETFWHGLWRHLRVHGEWFKATPELLEAIHTVLLNTEKREGWTGCNCDGCGISLYYGDDYEGWDTNTFCRKCIDKI